MIHPTEMPNDLQITRQAKLKPLDELAAATGIGEHLLKPSTRKTASGSYPCAGPRRTSPSPQTRRCWVLLTRILPNN